MISIVIPCYNAAATIAATIESALSQDVDKEIIVIDDGSTDSSRETVNAFQSRIRLVVSTNQGVSAARNVGTKLAQGRFVQYLDSDDLLLPGTLASRRGVLEDTGADIAHTDWQRLVQLTDGSYAPGEVMRPDLNAIRNDAELATATSAFWAPPAALLYRRSIVDRIGTWSARLPVIQDARFMFDAAANGARFAHVPIIGALYRVSLGSLSRRNLDEFIADCAVNASEIESLWRSRGTLSTERRKGLACIWQGVAMCSLFNGLTEFEIAREHHNLLARPRALIEFGRILRLMLGSSFSASLLNAAKWWREAYRCLAESANI
jgi:glycosyltransferase involved in cell wall biosynthesis